MAEDQQAGAPKVEQIHQKEWPVQPGFDRWLLTIMGIVSIILICGLILYLFANVSRLASQSARFLICLLAERSSGKYKGELRISKRGAALAVFKRKVRIGNG